MSKRESNLDERLESLLATLRPVPPRNPEAAARGKALFFEQAKKARTTVSQQSESRRKSWIGSIFPLSNRKVRFPMIKPLVAVLLAIGLFFGGTGATVYAAQESLPDQSLYPLKTFSEDALLSLTPSAQKQVDLNLAYSDRRISEIADLLAAGKPVPAGVADRLQNELDVMLEEVANLDDPALVQALEMIQARVQAQLETMNALMANGLAEPDLVRCRARLQEQVQLAASGEADPQGFRIQVRQRFQYQGGSTGHTPGTGNGQPGAGSTTPAGTPNPGGNGAGPGGYQDTNVPGQHGPGSQSPDRTPQPGGGSGHGP
jgi:hypothetical protein